jgi:hypothetical protein
MQRRRSKVSWPSHFIAVVPSRRKLIIEGSCSHHIPTCRSS